MVAIKTINGTAPPIEPMRGGYRITKSDLYSDQTGRSAETGKLIQYLIRKNVYTLELSYEGSDSVISQIETLINSTNFSVEFLDSGTYVTKTMYASDRSKEVVTLRPGEERTILSFSLIEV